MAIARDMWHVTRAARHRREGDTREEGKVEELARASAAQGSAVGVTGTLFVASTGTLGYRHLARRPAWASVTAYKWLLSVPFKWLLIVV